MVQKPLVRLGSE